MTGGTWWSPAPRGSSRSSPTPRSSGSNVRSSSSTPEGLALFSVTGASTALDHQIGAAAAVVLGAITGVGGGVLRDVLVREIPVVLRTGLYAIPALVGAAIVVAASKSGTHNLAFPILGAAVCFLIRLAAVYFDLSVPRPSSHDDGDPQ